ncbi:hypothetical protein ABBQ32_002579 [Trebouxia sp. C0010 RCD-2024]
MDELSKLSPASRERNLDELPRKELQQLAKEAGVKGNIKSKEIVQSLLKCLDGGEAVPGTAVKARPTSSAQAVAHADRAGSAGSDASKANSSTAFNAALAEAVEGALDSFPPSNTANDAAVNSSKDVQHGSSSPRPSESVSAPTTLAADPALAPQAAWGIASPAPQVVALYQPGSTQDTSAEEAAWAEQIPAATEEVSDPDCIGNPLYEEPDPVRQVPVAAAEPALLPASHPALPSSAPEATAELPVPSVGHPEQGSDEQDKPQTLEMQMSTTVESSAVVTNLSSSAAMETGVDFPPATDKPEQDAECMSDSQTLASHSVCNVCAASMEEQERMQLSESEEPAQPVQTLSISEEEQHRREATPEELANLGKAVDMVQARSCQLSPSLLTVGQTPPDMDSPARHAFERGRKSGIWQGSTEVELKQLERQWDDYKVAPHTLGMPWSGPGLLVGTEAPTVSKSPNSGFFILYAFKIAVFHKTGSGQPTPDCLGIKSGKRKAPSDEGDEAAASSKATGQPRKAVKRTQGHTPSRKGPALGLKGQSPAQKGPGPSPLRHLNGARGAQGPSRLAHSTHVSDIENAAKLANSSDQGKPETVEEKAATPLHFGAAANTGAKATKATGIPKPRPAVDRAKRAEATFAARRAAALAKVKK